MHRTPEEYRALRNKFKPDNINMIFLFESPVADGAYFYDPKNHQNDFVFKTMMRLIDFKYNHLNEQIKLQGLKKFKETGYYIIDSVYEALDSELAPKKKEGTILKNYDNLIDDLKDISADKKHIPIILVKSNLFALLNSRLKTSEFNVINESIVVPYLAHGKEDKFLKKLMEVFICQVIIVNSNLKSYYCSYGIPHEHSVKGKNVKAIILGSDPSNFSNHGKTIVMTHVFDLQNPRAQYFSSINNNIRLLGLNKDNIYVQNVVRNYMTKETADNRLWFDFAELWKPLLLEDLDKLDPKKELPVFATAECVLKALLNLPDEKKIPANKYYNDRIIVKPEENYLGRTLIPCFRGHYKYSEFPLYVEYIKQFVK
ncbi:MAG: hypothetical protein ABI543_13485 [Ignavibacteria bacterium]